MLLYDSPRGYAESIAQQLHISLTALRMLHPASAVASHVTVSIGIACVEPKFGRCPEGMTQLADETLYAAKEAGRNRTVVGSRILYAAHRRLPQPQAARRSGNLILIQRDFQ